MYRPVFLQNLCTYAKWGGTNVTTMFNIDSPYKKTGEVWTVSALSKGETPICIRYGDHDLEEKLSQYYTEDTEKIFFGYDCRKYQEFPLLAKWIDANDNLSVQVHPGDEYARINENSYGKSEAWYIVSAKPGAQIIYGLKEGTTKEMLEKAITENKIKDVLNFIPVNKGQIYYIPSGMVHALLDGVIVYEIQQSSDITYRLYDWDRNDPNRPLDLKKALDVIDFERNDENINTSHDLSKLTTPYFSFNTRKITGYKNIYTSGSSFKICSVLKGSLYITYGSEKNKSLVKAGQSFILPASTYSKYMYGYSVNGNAFILESTCK